MTKTTRWLFSLILHDPQGFSFLHFFVPSLIFTHPFLVSLSLSPSLLSPSPPTNILKHLLCVRLSATKPEQNGPPSYCHGAYKSNWELRHSSNNHQICISKSTECHVEKHRTLWEICVGEDFIQKEAAEGYIQEVAAELGGKDGEELARHLPSFRAMVGQRPSLSWHQYWVCLTETLVNICGRKGQCETYKSMKTCFVLSIIN